MNEKPIIHIVNLSYFGGIERLLSDNILSDNNHEHIIMNTSNSITKSIKYNSNKILFPNRISKHFKYQYPSFIRKSILWYKIKKINPSHVVIWNQVIPLKGKPKHIKAIYYDHGASWELKENEKIKSFFSMIDGCISVSNASKKMLEYKFAPNGSIKVVLNGAHVPDKITLKKEKKDTIIIGCAARITPLKALGLLPLIANIIKEKGFKVEVLIAGDGDTKEELIKLIAKEKLTNEVKLIGFVHDMADFYSKLDVYVSTSAHETCSLSCIEAMAFGVPLIAADIDGQPEIISDGETGYCIPATLSMADYQTMTGMQIPFNNLIYYPSENTISNAKLMSPELSAKKIIDIFNQKNNNFRQQSYTRAKKHFDINQFCDHLINTIKSF